jgi:putative NAD(P)-binding protein
VSTQSVPGEKDGKLKGWFSNRKKKGCYDSCDRCNRENVAEQAARAGVQHLVKLSTLQAGRPRVQLDQWHHAKEEVIQSSGLAWTFIRPGQFMSNALVELLKEVRRDTRGLLTDTVEKVTKRPARTFAEWCHENAGVFQ